MISMKHDARDAQGSNLFPGDSVQLPESFAKVIGRVVYVSSGWVRINLIEAGAVETITLPAARLLKVVIVPDM